jgi:tRNA(Ile2) C34 agmatinyltransferase TiaS
MSKLRCPKCGSDDVYKPDGRNGTLRCKQCRHQNSAIKFIGLSIEWDKKEPNTQWRDPIPLTQDGYEGE